MTATEVWENDQHDVSWRVMSAGATVNLTGATVLLLAESLETGEVSTLENTFSSGIVSHALDGTLPVGKYDLVVRVTLDGKTVTYPDSKHGAMRLTVKKRIESA